MTVVRLRYVLPVEQPSRAHARRSYGKGSAPRLLPLQPLRPATAHPLRGLLRRPRRCGAHARHLHRFPDGLRPDPEIGGGAGPAGPSRIRPSPRRARARRHPSRARGPCIGGEPIGIGKVRKTATCRSPGPGVQKAPGGATEWGRRRPGDARGPAATTTTGRTQR